MALFGSLGDIIQKALFNTTFTDIVESIDGLRARIEELNSKLEREVGNLQKQIEETQANQRKKNH